jgi:hypothetical protein
MEDTQNWHIEFFHDFDLLFDLLFVEVLTWALLL